MKKLSVLLISIFWAAGMLSAETIPSEDPDFSRAVAPIHPIFDWEGEVVIDGLANEGFWSLIEPNYLVYDVTDAWYVEGAIPVEPSDVFDVMWKATMDEDYFYLYVEVTDNEFVPRSMVDFDNAWDNDNIELFFLFADTTVVMPDWSLEQASQLRVWPDTDLARADSITGGGWVSGMVGSIGHLDYTSRTVLTDNGYTTEVRIPWLLIVPSVDGELGYLDDDDEFVPIVISELPGFQFDINVADRNDPTPEAGRDFIWSWSSKWNRNWGFTEAYGWLEIAEGLTNVSVPSSFNTNSLTVYPNPASTRLSVANLNGFNSIHIVNVVGQVVYATQSDAVRMDLDVSHLKNGVYMLMVIDESGNRVVEKFIKN